MFSTGFSTGFVENSAKVREMTQKTLEKGIEAVRRSRAQAPADSGVYQLKNNKNEIRYIGKAKELKARLAAYT